MNNLPTVYICGPMRGLPDFNFPAFDAEAAKWVEDGFNVINPAEEDRKAKEVHTVEEVEAAYEAGETPWIRRDVEVIMALDRETDSVVLLPGWENSNGARAEVALATWRGVRVLPPPNTGPLVRTFDTGATRQADTDKFDYEGFLSPLAIERFGAYMHEHRHLPDGSLRDSDNWQKGMPRRVYVKSLWRHLLDLWKNHRAGAKDGKFLEDTLCALLFNAQAYLHEVLLGREVQ